MSLTKTVPGGTSACLRRRGRPPRSADFGKSGDTVGASGMDHVSPAKSVPSYCEDQAAGNVPLTVELNDSRELKSTDSDSSADSESSNSDVCESDGSHADGSFQSRTLCKFQSLAWLNVNSNGKTAKSGAPAPKETVTIMNDDDGDDSAEPRQTGTGQSPMEQVKLTLPKSGVMLRMMVSSEEKQFSPNRSLQKLLANTKVSVVNRAPSKRARKASLRTTDTQTDNSTDLGVPSRSWTDVRDVNVNRYNLSNHSVSQRNEMMAPKTGFFASDEPPEGSVTFRATACQDSRRRVHSNDKEDVVQIPFLCDRQCALQRPSSSDKDVQQIVGMKPGSKAGKLLYGQGRGTEAHPLLPGPSWRFDNEHIDVCNNDHVQTAPSRRENNEGRQRSCTHDSTTMDPSKPLTLLQAGDVLKRHSDQYYEGDRHDKRARHNPQGYVGSCTDYSQQRYRDSSRDESEVMAIQDETGAKSGKSVKTRMVTTQMNRESTYPFNSYRMMKEADLADDQTAREHLDLTGLTNEEFSPFTTVSHASSSTLDAVKIAQFTEYTENMRKSMRQDYRNLSLLIKSFTDDLQERNNNQSSQSQSDVNQSEKATETNDKERCLIM